MRRFSAPDSQALRHKEWQLIFLVEKLRHEKIAESAKEINEAFSNILNKKSVAHRMTGKVSHAKIEADWKVARAACSFINLIHGEETGNLELERAMALVVSPDSDILQSLKQ